MNLPNHLRRAILVAALASAVAGGAAGTTHADNAPRTTPSAVSDAPPTAAADAPTPTGPLLAVVTKPTAPRSPTATPGNATVKLAWRAPSRSGGATINKYAVQRSRTGTSGWRTIGYPKRTSFKATGLNNGVRYNFRIRAHNRAGWSPASKVVEAVPHTKPTAPRSPTATPGNATVKLAWQAPSSNGGATVNKYAVQRAVAGGPWETIADPTTRSYTAAGLANGTRYYFRIHAYNRAGWGPSSTVVTTIPRTVPTAPQSPTATAGLYSAYLTWQKPASTGGAAIDKYIIEHRRYAEQEWKVLGETTASVLSYKAIGLTQIGNSHLFRIRAHNAAGSGAESTVVDALPLTEPERPWNLTATLNNGTVELKWAAPYDGGTPIQKYVVQQAINEGMFKTIGYPTTGSYTATVQPGLTYHYQIYAHNAAGNSAPSTTVSVTIPPKVPSAPTNCNAYQLGGKGSDTLRIEWGPPTSNGGAPILFYTIFVWGDPYQPPVMQTSVWNPNTSYDADIAVGEGGWVAVFAYNKAGGGPACQSVPFYMYP